MAEFSFLAACLQAMLMLAGLVLGIVALGVSRGRGGLGVVLPAVAGLVLSAGTLAQVVVKFASHL
ncbi:MAG TPA: hypothetical protein VG013_29535 [Gemmataceae bacterium]|nr:hypothetical protein [Gemmataceae bacterium]